MNFILKLEDSDLAKFKSEITDNEKERYRTSKSFDELCDAKFPAGKDKQTSNTKLMALIKANLPKIPLRSLPHYFKKLNVLIPALTYSMHTEAQALSSVRTLMKEKFGDKSKQYNSADENLIFKQKQARIKLGRKRLQEKHTEDILSVKLSTLYSVLDKTRSSDDWNDRVIFVQLSVGSRFIEVIKISDYIAIDDPHVIKIVGTAKSEEKEKEIIKPIIHGLASDVIQAVEFIRDNMTFKKHAQTNAQLTNALSKTVMVRIQKLFGIKLGTHDLRKIYGNASFYLFAQKSKTSLNGWLNKVLGHIEGNLETSLHYSTINIIDDIPKMDAETKEAMHEVKSAVERGEAKQEQVEDNLEVVNDDLNIVELKNRDGQKSYFKKLPRKPRLSQEAKKDRLFEAISKLTSNGIKATYAVLKKLGFGSRIITAARKIN